MTLSQVAVGSASLADGRLVDSAHQTQSKRPPSYDILKLPAEIVQEIACHALPADPRPLLREAPLSISQVCSSWRQAIINFPVVWRQLRLELYRGFRIDVICDSLINYFGRAGGRGLMLHLIFHQDRRYPTTFSQELTPTEHRQRLSHSPRLIGHQIALNFLRWLFAQQLTAHIQQLQVTTAMNLEDLLQPNSTSPPDFSRLEYLKFDRPPKYSNAPLTPVGLNDILNGAPKLHSLILSGTSLHCKVLNTSVLPPNHLRCLYLSIPLSDGQVVDLLDTCPSLERLRVVANSLWEWDMSKPRPPHRNLIDLRIQFDSEVVDIVGLVTHRSFEKLSNLQIYLSFSVVWNCTTNPKPADSFHIMPNLHSLHIHAPSQVLSPISYLEFFQDLPQLTHLSLDTDISKLVVLADVFLHPSAVKRHRPEFPHLSFTNLQSLTLTFLNGEDLQEEARHEEVVHLLEALISRTKTKLSSSASQLQLGSTTEPLTTCRLSLPMKDFPDDIEPIARAVAELDKELDFALDISGVIFAIKSNADVEWFES